MTILASEDTTAPSFQVEGFTCPFCSLYAQQNWKGFQTPRRLRLGGGSTRDEDLQLWVAQCFRCKEYSVWHKEKMIYSTGGIAPMPHPDLPDDDEHIKDDYLEARAIVSQSPRGAAALLRLIIQKLVNRIVEERKYEIKHKDDLNAKIGLLVKNGLRSDIQKALDIVRVIGNHALHPGQIDLKDDMKTALTLFRLVNMIAEDMITKPSEIESLFNGLPDEAKKGIERRDDAKNKVH